MGLTSVGSDLEAKDPIDLFIVGGQSNSLGKGDSSSSPDLPFDIGIEYANDSLEALSDPVGDAETGSAWPSFVERYYALTGNRVCIATSTVGSTAQTDAAADNDGSWGQSGNLRTDLVNEANNALDYLSANGFEPNFKGILWCQGEADSSAIDDGVITASDYQDAIRAMVDYYRSELGSAWSFYLFETGRPRDNDTNGFKAIRGSQRGLCRDESYPDCVYVSGEQKEFPRKGLMNSDNSVGQLHYSQIGYNIMGAKGASTIANGPSLLDSSIVDSGIVNFAPDDPPSDDTWATNNFTIKDVTFNKEFDSSPNVTVGLDGGLGGKGVCSVRNVTENGFEIIYFQFSTNQDSTPRPIYWIAAE